MSASHSPNIPTSEEEDTPTIHYDPNDPFWQDTEDDDDMDYVPAQGDSEDDDGSLFFHGEIPRHYI